MLIGLVLTGSLAGCQKGAGAGADAGQASRSLTTDANAGPGSPDGTQAVGDAGVQREGSVGAMDSAGTPSGEDGGAPGDADDGGRETSAGGDASAVGGDSGTADAGYLGENELTPFTYDGVNSVAFAQLPGSAD